jgi:hypothetical protein
VISGTTIVRIGLVVWLLMPPAARTADGGQTTGRVIAREVYVGLPRTTSTVDVDVFIVRAKEPVKIRGASTHFLRVRYEDYASQHPLPSGLLEGKESWRLSLKRDRSCDQLVSEWLIRPVSTSNELPKPGTYILVRGADTADTPPLHTTMPCFILRPGGIKPASGRP